MASMFLAALAGGVVALGLYELVAMLAGRFRR